MTRPRLINRVIRETSWEEFRRIQREASDRFLTFSQYVEQRCDELRDESAKRMLAQVKFERGAA